MEEEFRRLASKVEFSRLTGVTRAAVTKLCKGTFRSALVGRKIDLDHPVVAEYVEEKKKAAKLQENSEEYESKFDAEIEFEKIKGLTIGELVNKYGTKEQFKDWLDAVRTMEDVKFRQLRNAKLSGELIPRDLVSKMLIGLVDAQNRKLLMDSPSSIVGYVFAEAASGGDKINAENYVKEILNKQIRESKNKILRILKNVRPSE